MYGKSVSNIQIRHAIAIGQQKAFIADVFLNPLDASARLGVQPGIYHGYFPILGMIVKNSSCIVRQIYSHVTVMPEIIGKIFFNDILFVATTDYKFSDAIMAVSFHDMPKDRFPANLYHRLGNQIGGFTQTCTETTGKYYRFHFTKSLIVVII